MKPPAWLEATLCLLLKPEDRESVSGDLLEEYREVVRLQRGQLRADAWYAAEVAGFLARSSVAWGVLLGIATTIRFLFDAFAPVSSYVARADLSTWSHVGICLCAGFWSAWRSGHVRTGTLVALSASIVNAVFSIGATIAIVAIWHDTRTLRAIDQAGGLDESFVLPVMIVPVIALIGTVGAVFGKALAGAARLRRHRA